MRTFSFGDIPFVANMTPSAPPAGGFRADYRGTAAATSGTVSVPIGPSGERDVLCAYAWWGGSGSGTGGATATFGGEACTSLGYLFDFNPTLSLQAFSVTGVTGSDPVNFVLTPPDGSVGRLRVAVISARDVASINLVTAGADDQTTPRNLNQNVLTADETFLAAYAGTPTADQDWSFTGATELFHQIVTDTDFFHAGLAQHTAGSAETPRTFTATFNDASNTNWWPIAMGLRIRG
jgi:hypothetical protein